MDDTIVHASSYWGHLFGYMDKQKPDKRCSRLGTRAATQESGFGDHDGTAGPGEDPRRVDAAEARTDNEDASVCRQVVRHFIAARGGLPPERRGFQS